MPMPVDAQPRPMVQPRVARLGPAARSVLLDHRAAPNARDGRAGQRARPGRSLAALGRARAAAGRPTRISMAGRSLEFRAPGRRTRPRVDRRRAPGRLVPWLAIADSAAAVAGEFIINREPAAWGGGPPVAAAVAATRAVRGTNQLVSIGDGCSCPWQQGWRGSRHREAGEEPHPVLSSALWNVDIAGFGRGPRGSASARTAS